MRLLCDAMLGKLARDLRLLGYDVAYAGPEQPDDDVLERALAEERMLLTRDKALAHRAGPRGVLLRSAHGEELAETLAALGLRPREADFLSRCTECGERLVACSLPDLDVPADVAQAWKCPSCGHRYWEGTHVTDMRRRLARHWA